MRGVMSLLGLVVVVAIGLFIYRSYFTANDGAATLGTNDPGAAANIVGVKMDLNGMAQAQQRFRGRYERYASLEELYSTGELSLNPLRGREGYSYSIDIGGGGYTITATYRGPAKGMPTLSIDETMKITER